MRLCYFFLSWVVVGVLGGTGSVSADDAKSPIKLEKIKVSEVEKTLANYKGKVVVVDVWASFCAPCKKKFPHLVQLHKQHAKEGLVCISLSVDSEEDFKEALEFLEKHEATFPNFILLDSYENRKVLDKNLNNIAPPIIHVFDRKGKKIQTWEGKIEEDKIDMLIKDLLKEK